MRYRAFISYSHADARWAAWLHRSLESYRLPSRLRGGSGAHGPLPDRMSPIFRDREDLSSAGHLGPQIQIALNDSEALVVVCSPDAAKSPWVESEIAAFKQLGRGDRIYAFIVDGEPNAIDERADRERECFPRALRFDPDADGKLSTTAANPIAADARDGKDGRALARLKLLAGLFGLPLDTLRQREAQRRHRRMALVTTLAVLVMLVTSFLAVQAALARNDAERRQKQAEALVDFMLGDLNKKLSEVSRLDILSSVNDKAMAYFKSLPVTDITDEVLEQRSNALVKIGNVRSEQGDFPRAMESYQAASELSGSLAKAAPRDVARQLAHADVLAFLGTMHWYQGDLDGAGRSFDAAHAVLAKAQRFAPDNPKLLYQLSTVDNNNGHVLEGRGRIQQATANYERMLDAAQQLGVLGPDNIDWQNQLGLAHNNLAKMALLRGDLTAAIAGYRADVAIEARLATQDPRNNAQRDRLLISRATLGRTLALAGNLDEGSALLHQSLEAAKQLNAMESGSTGFQEDVGLYAYQLAKVERQRGHADAAKQLVQAALVMLDAMVKVSPDQSAWQRERAEALTEQAEQAIATGDADAAAVPLQDALKILAPQLEQNPQERGTVLATVNAWLRLASVSAKPQRIKLAQQSLVNIDAQTAARNDPRLLALRADALRQLGRSTEAHAIANALAASGYHHAGPPASAATHASHR